MSRRVLAARFIFVRTDAFVCQQLPLHDRPPLPHILLGSFRHDLRVFHLVFFFVVPEHARSNRIVFAEMMPTGFSGWIAFHV